MGTPIAVDGSTHAGGAMVTARAAPGAAVSSVSYFAIEEAPMELVLAYIDAGTGSMIIQMAIAGLVAIPFFFRTQIGRGVRAMRRATGRDRDRARDAGSTR